MFNKPKIASFYKGLFLLVLQVLVLISYSQDVHFSQSVASLQQRNAAFSNNFEGDFQIYSVYREQWGSIGVPFQTSMVGFTTKIDPFIKNLKFFAGFNYLNDQSGDANLTINRFGLLIGASYQIEENNITLAISNGFVGKQFNASALTFPEQYNPKTGKFDQSIDRQEDLINEELNYWNIGFALRWQRQISDKLNLNVGFSADNLNQAEETFFDSGNTQMISYGIQSEAEYKWRETMSLMPYFSTYRRQKASESVIGSGLRIHSNGNSNVNYIQPFLFSRLGISRNIDAMIVGVHLGIKKFVLGASYDFNISDLELASDYQGAFELSLIYTGRGKTLEKKSIPCERF